MYLLLLPPALVLVYGSAAVVAASFAWAWAGVALFVVVVVLVLVLVLARVRAPAQGVQVPVPAQLRVVAAVLLEELQPQAAKQVRFESQKDNELQPIVVHWVFEFVVTESVDSIVNQVKRV